MNHLTSSMTINSRFPKECYSNEDCSLNCMEQSFCNQTTNQCQIKTFSLSIFNELCLFISNLLLPDGNLTFIDQYQIHFNQCQQIIQDGYFSHEITFDTISFEIRQIMFLQNLKNLLWSHIEYQMGKITKKSTKKTNLLPPSSNTIK